MKKLLALLLILALLTPVFAACGGGEEATSTTENKPPYIPESTEGLKFELNEDEKSYTLVGLGSCEEGDIVIGSYKGLPVTSIASEAFYNERSAQIIYEVTIFDGVTQIESSAFRKCIYLRKITLPSTLEFIGSSAFQECDSLTEIVIPDGTEVIDKYAFYRCYDLQKVVLPNSLRSIGKKAFFECKLLSDIKIPSGLLEIGEDAFFGCDLLNKDDSSEGSTPQRPGPLDNTVSAFDGKYSLKNGSDGCYTVAKYNGNEKDIVIPKEYNGKAITKIAESSFSHVKCDSITIPNTITSIANYAFSVSACGCMDIHGCGVKQVIFEEGTELKGIPAYAFYNCKSLEKIEIPEGMTVIGTAAFCGCESLKEIKIPSNVTEIGNEAFGGCDSLEKIELPSKLTKIPDFMFYGAPALKDVTIPDGVTEIGSWAFASCISLESINIPASVVKMDDPYLYCSSVTSITVDEDNPVYMSSGNCLIERETRTLIRGCNTSVIPEDGMVVEIGDKAFSYCKGLKSINIPASVYVVPSQAFAFCNSLETITCSEKNKIYYAKGNCLIETETKKLVIGTVNSVIPSDGSVEIIGSYSFHGRKLQGTFVIPKGVTTIEQTSFTGSTLTGIDLPDSLTTLSGKSFNASKLESITLPKGINAYGMLFMDCEYLKTVVISEGAESIGEYAFRNCIALENVVIPSTVKTIGNYAFYNCKSLKKISLPSSLEKMGTSPFFGCDNLEKIEFGNVSKLNLSDYSMFEELKKLKGNEYDNAIYLGNSENPYAFLLKAKDTSITSGEIHEDTYAIGPNAFKGCDRLSSIVVPDGVAAFCKGAFAECSSLENINIPSGITEIPDNCFDACVKLKSIDLPSGLTRIGYAALKNTGITEIELPDTLTHISMEAFQYCRYLESIVLPTGIVEVLDDAFDGCIRLKYDYTYENALYIPTKDNPHFLLWKFTGTSSSKPVIHPDTKWIADSAFLDSHLNTTELRIPEGVTEIHDMAFVGSGLKKVLIPSTVKLMGIGVFRHSHDLEIYYNGTMEEWKAIKGITDRWDDQSNGFIIRCSNGTISRGK